MLDKQQEGQVRADFAAMRDGVWLKWFSGEIKAKRDGSLQRMEDSGDLNEMLKAQAESKTLREVLNLLEKFDEWR